jgi:hypothetical protein
VLTVTDIVDAFYDKLPHIAWMDEPSYKAAQKKAKAMIPKVGYPLTPNTTDPESLQRWYSRVPVSSDDYFGSILNTLTSSEHGLVSVRSEIDRLGRCTPRLSMPTTRLRMERLYSRLVSSNRRSTTMNGLITSSTVPLVLSPRTS